MAVQVSTSSLGDADGGLMLDVHDLWVVLWVCVYIWYVSWSKGEVLLCLCMCVGTSDFAPPLTTLFSCQIRNQIQNYNEPDLGSTYGNTKNSGTG